MSTSYTMHHLTNGTLDLAFDPHTGRWLSLTDLRDGAVVLDRGDLVSALLLTVGGRTAGTRGFNQMFTVTDAETVGHHWRLEGFERGDAAMTVNLTEGDWRVAITYRLRSSEHSAPNTEHDIAQPTWRSFPDRVAVDLRLAYTGPGEVLLRHFTLRTPYMQIDRPAEWRLEAPGHALRPGRLVSWIGYGGWGELQEGAFADALAWRPPLVGVHAPGRARSLGFWAYTETEPFYPRVDRTDLGLMFSHRVYLADRFTRDHSLEWRTQYLQIWHTEWLPALEQFQAFYDEAGLRVPDDTPEWARRLNLYEVHVGTLNGTQLTPYPTYDPLIADLPRIRDKGFDAIYIMPHVPYPSYSVVDYHDLDVQQGSAAGFRALVERAHALGLKVLMDVTIHGVMDRRARRWMVEKDGRLGEASEPPASLPEEHPYVRDHPEWFSRTEAGEIATTYTLAFDHANPSWQEFMAGVFRFYVEEFGVDGFRVDSHTWNFFPNWARDLPYPASRSMYGSHEMLKRVRQELKRVKSDVILYTETAGPLFHASHELGYNYDETWMLLSAFPLLSHRGLLCHYAHAGHVTGERINARDIAMWLHQRRLALPRGAIKMRHLDSHDSYWRPREFRRQAFGIPAARAAAALFALIDGGFMDYNGADEGMEEFYARLMHLRRTHPVLQHGACDYLAVEPSDPWVFAPLRSWEGSHLLPVINLRDTPVSVRLSLPAARMGLAAARYAVSDLMSGRRIPGPDGDTWERDALMDLRTDVDGFGVTLLEFGAER